MSFTPISQSLPVAPPRPQASTNRPMGTPAKRVPAAGASGGAKPMAATVFPPYHYKSQETQYVLLNVLRDPLCTHLYDLVHSHCVFTTGEFLGSYARLIELCTPPQPERGKRRLGPSMQTVRRAINDLVHQGLMVRGETNESQGQLRLWLTPLKNKVTPIRKDNRV